MTQTVLVSTPCPICHFGVAAPFFDGGDQPLATLGWSKTQGDAQAMTRHPLDYVQCPRCTHVWNRSFTYDAIPYEKNPNRMFNSGLIWQGHLRQTRDLVLSHLPDSPTVIDIGCGEGHFVRGISEQLAGQGRFMGFDPNATEESGRGVEFHACYFEPLQHMSALAPDLIVMRHVMEHLTNPASFMDQLALAAGSLSKPVYFFVETPCIDRVLTTLRLGDFFYEHPSQFNTTSFRTLMERGGTLRELAHGYDGEVVYGLIELKSPDDCARHIKTAAAFQAQASLSRTTIRSQLDDLLASGHSIAIWGGTGKAAAFIHQFDITCEQIPLVVDSDPDKVGTFVPKSGQQIQFRDVLKAHPADIVIIPSQWRARDIAAEMQREHIVAQTILIEHLGRLIDFNQDSHPYKTPKG